MNQMKLMSFVIAGMLLTSCAKNKSNANPVTPGDSLYNLSLSTNKAVYRPGEMVLFTADKLPVNCRLRYRHLDEVLKDEPFTSSSWNWTLPPSDFKGYLVEVYTRTGNEERSIASIAIDASSDNLYFPRNGFLSNYGPLSNDYMASVINNLNRHHINVVQFQDWEFKHHLPLAGTVINPQDKWKDIANRENTMSTVKQYISLAHGYNMKTLSYNLIYGALSDASSDGVKDQWYMYQDQQHVTKEIFALPKPPFKSDIYFLDPSNTGWQNYIAARTKEAFEVYDFDGFQVDQVGNRDKNLYDYSGNPLNLEATFRPFLEEIKTQMPEKKLVMNAVNQYGQQISIAKSPVDFLYSEVWAPDEGYKDLARIIRDNDRWSDHSKKTVLCAYMDYKIAESPGFFNTPGVLLTNSVIFSFGGAHLELGEHMLGKEYFPNNNLQMKDDLKSAMVHYYDFIVAYENLLRDGGDFNTVSVNSTNGKMNLNAWPPQNGSVSVQGKAIGAKQILHFINFANAATFDWRDANGTQTAPKTIVSANISVNYTGTATKVWMASPDINFGIPQLLSFSQSGNTVKFTLPELKYWDMAVIE